MRVYVILAVFTVMLVEAQEGITLTDEQKLTLSLGLCPAYDYMACLKNRIDADEALKACVSNSDCDVDSGSFCCPSKCAGMRCLPEGSKHFIEEYCPKFNPADLLRNCIKMDNQCTTDCRCCVDVETCSYRCLQ